MEEINIIGKPAAYFVNLSIYTVGFLNMGEKKMAKKMKTFLLKHPLAGSIGIAALSGVTISFIYYILVYVKEEWHDTASVLKELVMLPIFGSMIGMFLIFPILVTI